MDETTTTAAPAESGAIAQPDLGTEMAAAEADTEQTQPDPSGSAEPDESTAWLRNKGIDPSDTKAVAEAWRKAETEFHKSRQEAKTSELHAEAMDATKANTQGDDQVMGELQMLRTEMAVERFYRTHPDAEALDTAMAEVVKARPHLAQDLDAVYALAKANQTNLDVKKAETKGREDAKADIARASAATLPKGNAAAPAKTEAKDSFLEGFTSS